MKTKLFLAVALYLCLHSCTKTNEAGIQIDGNGKPVTHSQSETGSTEKVSSTITRDSLVSNYGIAIDPDGGN